MSKKYYRWILIIFDGRNKTILNIDLLKTTRGSVRTLSNKRDDSLNFVFDLKFPYGSCTNGIIFAASAFLTP